MIKVFTIGFLIYIMYRLVFKGGLFLTPESKEKSNIKKKGDYVDYEEVESKVKK